MANGYSQGPANIQHAAANGYHMSTVSYANGMNSGQYPAMYGYLYQQPAQQYQPVAYGHYLYSYPQTNYGYPPMVNGNVANASSIPLQPQNPQYPPSLISAQPNYIWPPTYPLRSRIFQDSTDDYDDLARDFLGRTNLYCESHLAPQGAQLPVAAPLASQAELHRIANQVLQSELQYVQVLPRMDTRSGSDAQLPPNGQMAPNGQIQMTPNGQIQMTPNRQMALNQRMAANRRMTANRLWAPYRRMAPNGEMPPSTLPALNEKSAVNGEMPPSTLPAPNEKSAANGEMPPSTLPAPNEKSAANGEMDPIKDEPPSSPVNETSELSSGADVSMEDSPPIEALPPSNSSYEAWFRELIYTELLKE
jgi:hypothetical protein